MSKIQDVIAKQREALGNKDGAVMDPVLRAYRNSEVKLTEQLDRLQKRIETLQASGKPVRVGTIFALEQTKALLALAKSEGTILAAEIQSSLGAIRPEIAAQAIEDAKALALLQLGETPPGAISIDWVDVNRDAVNAIVATTQEGPLREILDGYGDAAAQDMAATLTSGVIRGRGALEIARDLRDASAISLARAKTIARTETNRVYRAASHQAMQANADILKGWIWTSAGLRACAICLLMDGTLHPLEEPMTSHPNCRCAPTPLPKTWKELGFDVSSDYEQATLPTPGWKIFESAPEDVQRRILGKKAFDAYKAGDVSLHDFLSESESEAWGKTRTKTSLKQALRHAENGRGFPYEYADGSVPPGGSPFAPPAPVADSTVFLSTLSGQIDLNGQPLTSSVPDKASLDYLDGAFLNPELAASAMSKRYSYEEVQRMFREANGLPPTYDVNPAEIEQWIGDSARTWNRTSGDNDRQAILAQVAVRDEFDLGHATTDHFPANLVKEAEESPALPLQRAVSRGIYEATQEDLASAGITEVELHRGVRFQTPRGVYNEIFDGESITHEYSDTPLQPISSFSADPDLAEDFVGTTAFGRYVHRVRVPASAVFSTARTGFGTRSEREYVVLSLKGQGTLERL